MRGAVEHHYRAKAHPRVSDEAWAAAPPIAKQAAVSASLQTIDAYARAASADGGFDHGNAHLTRTALHLDARGYGELSRACQRLLGQVERIEEAAGERLQRNPHSGESREVSLVMMLFETSRLSAESGHAHATLSRRVAATDWLRSRTRPDSASKRSSRPRMLPSTRMRSAGRRASGPVNRSALPS